MDKWNVWDSSDWGDSVAMPDKAYMGYINGGNDDDYEMLWQFFRIHETKISRA